MANRLPRFTKEEIKRVALVAKELGDDYAVEIDPDGTLRIVKREKRSHRRPVEEIPVF